MSCARFYFAASSVLMLPLSLVGPMSDNPPVAGLRLSHWKPIQTAASTIVSNELVVGENFLLGPSCQWYS